MVDRCVAASSLLPGPQNPEEFRGNVQRCFGEEWDRLPPLRSFFTTQQQERVLTATAHTMVVIVPMLAAGSVGLEASVIRILSTALKIFEELQRPGGGGALSLTLRSIAIALKKMDPLQGLIPAHLDLFKRCAALALSNIETWDEKSCERVFSGLNDSIEKLNQFGGIASRVLEYWKEQLEHRLVPGPGSQPPVSALILTRLFALTNSIVSSINTGVVSGKSPRVYFSPDGIDSARSIFDLLEHSLAVLFQQQVSAEHKEKLRALRESILVEFCKGHPLFAIERIDALLRPSPLPEFAFLADQIAQCSQAVLQEVDPAKFSNEQILAYCFRLNAFAVRFCPLLSKDVGQRFAAAILVFGRRIPDDRPIFNQIPRLMEDLVLEMNRLPSLSLSACSRLLFLLIGVGLLAQERKQFADLEGSKTYLRFLNTFSTVAGRVVLSDPKERAELDSLLVTATNFFCTLRPSLGLELLEGCHFDAWNQKLALNAALQAMKEMGPRRVCATYAADQLSQILSFVLRRFHEMDEQERSTAQELFSGARALWKLNDEVSSALIQTWTRELDAFMKKAQSPAEKQGAKKGGRASDRSREEIVKLSNTPFLNAIIQLFMEDLSFVSSEDTPLGRGGLSSMSSLLSVIDRFILFVGKDRLLEETQRLIGAIAAVAPTVLIDQLNSMDAGKAPCGHVRRMERILFSCSFASRLADAQQRLFLLEWVGASLERFCVQQQFQLEPHPRDPSFPTVRPKGARSPLHLQLEDAIPENLDIFCAANCKEYENDPSQREQVFFALRFYLRSLIKPERRQYATTHREIERASWVEQADEAFGLRLTDPKKIYTTSDMEQYDKFCSGAQLSTEAEPFLNKIVQTFGGLFQNSLARAQILKGSFGLLWPHYETAVASYKRHTEKMVGYAPKNRVLDGPVYPKILIRGSAPIQAVIDRSFAPWIQGLLSGGEEGLARAVFASLVPEDDAFVTNRLKEHGLLYERADPSPDLETASPPVPPVEATKPKKAAAHPPKTKAPKEKQKKQEDFSFPSRVPLASSLPSSQAPSQEESPLSASLPSIQDEPPSAPEESSLPPLQPKTEAPTPPRRQAPHELQFLRPMQATELASLFVLPPALTTYRVYIWDSYFRGGKSPLDSNRVDQRDSHAYTKELASVLMRLGSKVKRESNRSGVMNDSYVCIGEIERVRAKLPALFGLFSEGFATNESPHKHYHHSLLKMSFDELIYRYERTGSFFDQQGVDVEFQRRLYERAKSIGSFFAPMDDVPSVNCLNGRLAIKIADTTVEIEDRWFGCIYKLALKILSSEKKGRH